ncbi:hypothetical protein BHE74_00034514 [Ensete ventricosum]|uniref:BRX domain-containing protein n=1 Tax=Ensete ventricosum TaxID=4639 RepID=A0A445MDL8_ENSVE|nr:hypothetical protein BHE74_00034514 [Ensete ventricosum]RZR72314.1 hypothetical protein BHM03_00012396 [Ensete ventricosum]
MLIVSFLQDGDSVSSGRPYGVTLESTLSISRGFSTKFQNRDPSVSLPRSDVGSDHANMQLRASNGDGVRLSVSSAPSSSSQGSGPDDIESLGDVYVWGEVWSDGVLLDGSANSICSKTDVLIPRSLESNVVLDVHQIACGVRHAALVTRQGEVFTWGDESGGQLGHGNDKDVSRPRLVESLVLWNMDYVACGEYHTCAISTAGDLFTWGDGTHNTGLLGHGNDVSHWIPKKVSGPLEGLQVLSIACGTWHSALTTSNGKVYTFGDGTFGVLGHGDRESVACPREVESLSGLRTIKVACGVWHTAAIVEVMGQTGVNVISRKLFTWGDGDKYRLGHGDKEARLVPTCVPSLIDYNFHQLACGHNITVGLTTSGHVFTMGSMSHGQLGNPQSDGRVPCLVQERLVGELVEEIACGAYHVAVLTSRSEVYTWGKGSNGRLGHGDAEDRKTPTLVEALKDRHVKNPLSILRAPQVPSLLQLKDISFTSSLSALQTALKPIVTSAPPPPVNSKPASPYSRKPSPPRTATPVFSKSIIDSLTRTNELLNQDLQKLQAQSAIEGGAQNSRKLVVPDNRESTSQHSIDNGLKSPPSSRQSTDGEAELVEQFEPGVYITFIQLRNSIKMFKRVRFSKRRFAEQQAEDWWNKNKERVFKKYSYPGQATATLPMGAPNEEEDVAPSS